MAHRCTLIVALIALSSCSSDYDPGGDVYVIKQPFDFAAYAPYDLPGTGVVEGQASADGTRCVEVAAYPATPYVREGVEASRRIATKYVQNPAVHADQRVVSYHRWAKCDELGRFRFENMPAGPWYIEAGIRWISGWRTRSGVNLAREIVITDGVTKVELTEDEDALQVTGFKYLLSPI